MSLLQHHNLKSSILQCTAFFTVQLSHLTSQPAPYYYYVHVITLNIFLANSQFQKWWSLPLGPLLFLLPLPSPSVTITDLIQLNHKGEAGGSQWSWQPSLSPWGHHQESQGQGWSTCPWGTRILAPWFSRFPNSIVKSLEVLKELWIDPSVYYILSSLVLKCICITSSWCHTWLGVEMAFGSVP